MSEAPKDSSRGRFLVGTLLSVVLVSTALWWWSAVKSVFMKAPLPVPSHPVANGPIERQYSCDNFLGMWGGEWQEASGSKANPVCYRIEKSAPLRFSVMERARARTDPSRIVKTVYPATCEEDGTLTYGNSQEQTEMTIVNGQIALAATQLETRVQIAQGTMQKGSCPLPD